MQIFLGHTWCEHGPMQCCTHGCRYTWQKWSLETGFLLFLLRRTRDKAPRLAEQFCFCLETENSIFWNQHFGLFFYSVPSDLFSPDNYLFRLFCQTKKRVVFRPPLNLGGLFRCRLNKASVCLILIKIETFLWKLLFCVFDRKQCSFWRKQDWQKAHWGVAFATKGACMQFWLWLWLYECWTEILSVN